jgi:hypothetical protein
MQIKIYENSTRLKLLLSVFMIAFSIVLALNAPADPQMLHLK